MAKEKLVKLIVLKSGEYGMLGQKIEVSEEKAKLLTMVRKHFDHNMVQEFRLCKPADEKDSELKPGGLTAASGFKNVVQTPPELLNAAEKKAIYDHKKNLEEQEL